MKRQLVPSRGIVLWVIAAIALVLMGMGVATIQASTSSSQAAPDWLEALALQTVQANTTAADSAEVSVGWTLIDYGQYEKAIPDDPVDPSVTAKPVYVVVLQGPIASNLASSLDGKPVTGAALVLTVNPATRNVDGQVILPQSKVASLSALGNLNAIEK